QPYRKDKKMLAVFLSLKIEIAEAIIDGWSIRSIWQLLKDENKIECGYVRFIRICNKHGINKECLTPEKMSLLKEGFHSIKTSKSASSSNIDSSIERCNYRPTADIK
ncbi:TraK family protein, partial [Streptobacillus moniliformis]|uniref:TraK family protein n=1 Tax=Streptobacillus moniliformis TaxID=34105 RepID=UPI0009BDF1CE